jgi:hypothetical protein
VIDGVEDVYDFVVFFGVTAWVGALGTFCLCVKRYESSVV